MKIESWFLTHRVALLRVLLLPFVLSFGTILVGESASRSSSRWVVQVSAAYSLGSLPLECFVVFVKIWVRRGVSEVGHADPTPSSVLVPLRQVGAAVPFIAQGVVRCSLGQKGHLRVLAIGERLHRFYLLAFFCDWFPLGFFVACG